VLLLAGGCYAAGGGYREGKFRPGGAFSLADPKIFENDSTVAGEVRYLRQAKKFQNTKTDFENTDNGAKNGKNEAGELFGTFTYYKLRAR
jgi:hypothetical protein